MKLYKLQEEIEHLLRTELARLRPVLDGLAVTHNLSGRTAKPVVSGNRELMGGYIRLTHSGWGEEGLAAFVSIAQVPDEGFEFVRVSAEWATEVTGDLLVDKSPSKLACSLDAICQEVSDAVDYLLDQAAEAVLARNALCQSS